MKYSNRIFALFSVIAISSACYSQLVADAGNDTAFCDSKWEEASFGGNPSATGGTEPYTYAWSAEYEYAGRIYPASSFLVDTSVANPVFKEYFEDSAVFYLTVSDSNDGKAYDSVRVRFSNYSYCLADCREEIAPGDSVKIGHCIMGGIPPYQFSWTPEESLSDPNIATPWAKPLLTTSYALVLTDSLGCQATSSCKVLVTPSGIPSNDLNGDFHHVYPNPASGIVNFSFTHPQYQNSVLKIFSAEGKLVKEVLLSEPVLTIDLSEFGQGLYLYNWMISDETVGSGKIVIE